MLEENLHILWNKQLMNAIEYVLWEENLDMERVVSLSKDRFGHEEIRQRKRSWILVGIQEKKLRCELRNGGSPVFQNEASDIKCRHVCYGGTRIDHVIL